MASLIINAHGGGCCGIRHISGFHNFHVEDIGKLKEKVKLVQGRSKVKCVLVEAVVTAGQLRTWPLIKKGLRAAGFRKVSSFLNKNSDNLCYVYHYRVKPELEPV